MAMCQCREQLQELVYASLQVPMHDAAKHAVVPEHAVESTLCAT